MRAFAMLGVATYYAHRLPALAGGGVFPGDGKLVDLHRIAPEGLYTALAITPMLVFGLTLALKRGRGRAWQVRPPAWTPV